MFKKRKSTASRSPDHDAARREIVEAIERNKLHDGDAAALLQNLADEYVRSNLMTAPLPAHRSIHGGAIELPEEPKPKPVVLNALARLISGQPVAD